MITLNYGYKVLEVTTDTKGAKMSFEVPMGQEKYMATYGATKQQVFDAMKWANEHGRPVVALLTSSIKIRPHGKGVSLKLPEVSAWVKTLEAKKPETLAEIVESIQPTEEAKAKAEQWAASVVSELSAMVEPAPAIVEAGPVVSPAVEHETDEARSRREFEERQAAMPAKCEAIKKAHPEMDATDIDLKARADLRKAQKAAKTRKATEAHKAYLASKAAPAPAPWKAPAPTTPRYTVEAIDQYLASTAPAGEKPKEEGGEENPFLEAIRRALAAGVKVERTSAAWWLYLTPEADEIRAAVKAAGFYWSKKRAGWYKPAPTDCKRKTIKTLEEVTL